MVIGRTGEMDCLHNLYNLYSLHNPPHYCMFMFTLHPRTLCRPYPT